MGTWKTAGNPFRRSYIACVPFNLERKSNTHAALRPPYSLSPSIFKLLFLPVLLFCLSPPNVPLIRRRAFGLVTHPHSWERPTPPICFDSMKAVGLFRKALAAFPVSPISLLCTIATAYMTTSSQPGARAPQRGSVVPCAQCAERRAPSALFECFPTLVVVFLEYQAQMVSHAMHVWARVASKAAP